MRGIVRIALGALVCCVFTGSLAFGVDVPGIPKVAAANTFRGSKLSGMLVKNSQSERLGVVEDLVFNVETGKISYVAVGVGGVFGVGEKLYAIPFSLFSFAHGQNEMFFVLDMSKDKLKTAPAFDKRDWPNVADPKWSQEIDEFYRRAQATDLLKYVPLN